MPPAAGKAGTLPSRYAARSPPAASYSVTLSMPSRSNSPFVPKHCGDFAEVLHAFEVWGDHLRVDRIVDYALRLDGATSKRLGWVLESRGVPAEQLGSLQELAIKGYRKLDPTGPREGPLNRRWMIQENLPGKLRP